MIIKLTWLFLAAVLFCEMSCSATLINSGDQYFVKLAGKQTGCADKGAVKFMSYLNKTCSESGPVLRAASDGKTWTKFTFTKVGKSASGEDLVEIQTYYPKSSSTPRCQGYVVPEKKDACLEAVAGKVRIQAKKGDIWVLSAVKAKKDTYSIRAYSRKSGCLKYLAASVACGEKSLQLDAKDDGSGRQHWTILPVKTPAVSPPPLPQFVDIPAVNYSIAVTGYTPQSFGAPQQTAFCNSIYNSTTYPQDYMKCVVLSVSEVPYQGSSSSSGRKLAQSGTVYVRGYTAFEFIYGNTTSQQQAEDAADGLYKTMDSPASLQTMFQSSFSSSAVAPYAVDRGEVPVPENTLPTPDLPSPSSPSPTPSSPSPTPSSPSPFPASPTLSPTFNTVPGGDGVSNLPPVTSPVPVPTPVPTPAQTTAYGYVANLLSSSVTACTIINGAVTVCSTPYTGPASNPFSGPAGIAIVGTTAYINDYGASSLYACTISAGSITGCTTPFIGGGLDGPFGIAISGTTAFIANANNDSISRCTVSGLAISACVTTYSGGNLSSPRGIAILGNTAFIANFGDGSVTSCTISTGFITTCATPYTGGGFVLPSGIAISGSTSTAYITDLGGPSIIACTISGGFITTCATPYTGGGFTSPDGVTLSGSTAYFLNAGGTSSIISRTVSGLSISSCGSPYIQAGAFNIPVALAIA